MKADILREKFLNFFKSKKHRVVDSDLLIPQDDPTVLFTPAGMNQFKKQFMGQITGFSRATSSQRCLRTDDLDKVGKTAVHHTFFEMLGNFSFGDYFKKEAIVWAWEFLTKELKISSDKLWVSVYKDDDEAYRIWQDIVKVPEYKIIKLGDKDNFWPSDAKEKGPNGPCGPCSEIFFDFGVNPGCKNANCNPACSCGRFAEIWNLVFTQFNRKEGGVLEPLPQKNIDTGMGLERLAAVMQGVSNNFETDLFAPLVKEIIAKIDTRNPLPVTRDPNIYAVADHLRAVVFSIYDGILPSNEGRGYVVRKIIRKATYHLRGYGVKKPLLYKLVPVAADIMKVPYPDLVKRREDIAQIILAEENNFHATINTSANLLKEKFDGFKENQNPEEAGKTAFCLYDTYGIPVDLTKDWLDKMGIKFSQEAFDGELLVQKERSKAKSTMKGDVFDSGSQELNIKVKSRFLGYTKDSSEADILKIFVNGKEKNKVSSGEEAWIVLDKTPFYAESGGQVGDTGSIKKGKSIFQVTNAKKIQGAVAHIGKVISGSFKVEDEVKAEIELSRRKAIQRNHSATHLLQAALRQVLGAHVKQQGSLVADSRLRFDFTHFKSLNDEELSRVEELVNNYILLNEHIEVKEMTMQEAKRKGALAFFADKYGDKVRLVTAGELSKELCGGTHVSSTGEIGLFKITQESSVAAGVRRIEAVTADKAYQFIRKEEEILSEVSQMLGAPQPRILEELQKKINLVKDLELRLKGRQEDLLKSSVDELVGKAVVLKGVRIITHVFDNVGMDVLRKNIDTIKAKAQDAVIALGARNDDKALLVVGVASVALQKGLDAGNLVRQIAQSIGGSGGGRPDFAQAGGDNPQNFPEAFRKLEEIINNLL